MKVFIDYTHDYNSKRYFLRSGQAITVGSSQLADLTLAGANLAPKHFEISSHPSGCMARNLVAPKGQVRVNGEEIEKIEIGNGDEIEAGNIVFKIEMEGAPPKAQVEVVATAAVEEPSAPDSDAEYKLEETEPSPAIRKAAFSELVDKIGLASRLVSTIGERFSCYLACNFKLMDTEPLEGCDEENNLFKDFPDQVQESHSLHLLGQGLVGDVEPHVQSLLESGKPFLIVFSKTQDKDEFIKQMRLHLAWLCNPDTMDFHIEQGTRDFLNALFASISCLLVHPSDSDGFSLYLNSDQSAGRTDFDLQDALEDS